MGFDVLLYLIYLRYIQKIKIMNILLCLALLMFVVTILLAYYPIVFKPKALRVWFKVKNDDIIVTDYKEYNDCSSPVSEMLMADFSNNPEYYLFIYKDSITGERKMGLFEKSTETKDEDILMSSFYKKQADFLIDKAYKKYYEDGVSSPDVMNNVTDNTENNEETESQTNNL